MDLEYKSEEAAAYATNVVCVDQENVVPKYIIKYLQNLRGNSEVSEPKFDSMLDVGCGYGRSIVPFAPYFRSVIGCVISEAQIEKANELNTFKHLKYVVGQGESMPVADGSVDFVNLYFSAHFMDVEKLEKEIYRVLKSSGLAAIWGHTVEGVHLNTGGVSTEKHAAEASILENEFNLPFKLHADKIGHPERHIFDSHKEMFHSLTLLNKRRCDDLKFDFVMTLKAMKMYYNSIPFFANVCRDDVDHMEKFGNALKNLWNLQSKEDDDIEIRITYSVSLLLLTKQ